MSCGCGGCDKCQWERFWYLVRLLPVKEREVFRMVLRGR